MLTVLCQLCQLWPLLASPFSWCVTTKGQSTVTQFSWFKMTVVGHFRPWPPIAMTQFIEWIEWFANFVHKIKHGELNLLNKTG